MSCLYLYSLDAQEPRHLKYLLRDAAGTFLPSMNILQYDYSVYQKTVNFS